MKKYGKNNRGMKEIRSINKVTGRNKNGGRQSLKQFLGSGLKLQPEKKRPCCEGTATFCVWIDHPVCPNAACLCGGKGFRFMIEIEAIGCNFNLFIFEHYRSHSVIFKPLSFELCGKLYYSDRGRNKKRKEGQVKEEREQKYHYIKHKATHSGINWIVSVCVCVFICMCVCACA